MKEIKFLLILLASGIYTSSWWAAAIFNIAYLWYIPGILTFVAFMGAGIYCDANWKNDL